MERNVARRVRRKLTGVFFVLILIGAGEAHAQTALHVGVIIDCPPLSFSGTVYPERELRGLGVDLARVLNESLGRDTVFHEGDLDQLRAWLNDGTIDYLCALPMASAHTLPNASFVVTNFALNRRILVHNRNMHINSVDDFKRHRIAFLARDNYHKTIDVPRMEKVFMRSYREALRALSRGEVDAFVPPCSEIATYISQREETTPVVAMGIALERVPLLLVFPRETTLKGRIAEALSLRENDGSLDTLRSKWLGREIYHEPTLWEEYQRTILYSIGALVALVLMAMAWTLVLRRQVARVTRRLRYTEQSYEGLFDASPDMVFMLDVEGRIKLANRAARYLLFESTDLPKDKNLFAFLDKIGGDKLQALLEATAEGINQQVKLTLRPEKGAPHTVEMNAFLARDSISGSPMICCIARDITERARMEKELIEAERLVIIGKMAAGIAHEVNNPLNVILTNAELVEEVTDDEETLACVRAILHSVDRAAGTIRQLLDLSSSPVRMEFEPLNLAAMARESVSFLKPRLKKVRVNFDKLPESLPIHADRLQIEQLLLNLLLNALASMKDEGTLTLAGRLDYSGVAGSDGTVRLVVQDDGKGIARENLERIFDIFFTTRNREGFGLGLYLCRCIAERYDGLLFAESEEGSGASLILELPIYKQEKGGAEKSGKPQRPPS